MLSLKDWNHEQNVWFDMKCCFAPLNVKLVKCEFHYFTEQKDWSEILDPLIHNIWAYDISRLFTTTVKLGYNELGYNEYPLISNKLNTLGWYRSF